MVLALAACESTGPGTGSTVSTLMIPKLTPTVTESQDFVKARRPTSHDFIPIASNAPERRMKPKSAAEAGAAEARLAAAARRHDNLRVEQERIRRRTLANAPKPRKPE